MSAYLLKPCKGSKGFQAVTDRNMKLKLNDLEDRLVGHGFTPKVCVKIIMVMQKDDLEFTIYPSGKFLIKPSISDMDLSQERAEIEANSLLDIFHNIT